MSLLSKHRRTVLAATALAAAACGTVAAGDAEALVVSSDENGLQMREPDNVLNRVTLSLVDAGGLKYRVEMPEFGGRGIGFGPGCTEASTRPGVDVALCDRVNPVVSQVSFGPLGDSLEVDPGFPDPIVMNDGGIGPDGFFLGAGDDTASGGRGDRFFGLGGDDVLTSLGGTADGGEGDDQLRASGERRNHLVGGPGDDALSAAPGAGATMVGGAGVDSFQAGGANGTIDARDGVAEQVSCGEPTEPARGFLARRAVVDLLDVPSDAELLAGGCTVVDRAPRGEKMAVKLVSRSLKVRRGKAAIRLRCTTAKRCRGKVSVTARGRTRGERFLIPGRRTAVLHVAARRGAATVRIAEAGVKGPRTLRAGLRARR